MESEPITNTEDLIHTDDLFARIKWLEQELNYRCTDEHSEELKASSHWREMSKTSRRNTPTSAVQNLSATVIYRNTEKAWTRQREAMQSSVRPISMA